MWKNRLTAWLRPVFTLFALAGVLSLAACGGGNGAPNNPYQGGGGPLTVLPKATIIYAGVPSTLTISGGTAPFQAFSSDSTLLPVTQAASTTIPLLANSVAADTTITVTIRDAIGTTVTAAVTVKPSFLLPASITITGNPVCAASSSDLCSGQDGTASVQLTGAAGTPLAGRQVRFDVVLGTFSLIAANSTIPTQTLTVLSDQNGLAVVTIRVPSSALTQFATIRATDVASGSSVVAQFTIANGVLSVIPTGTTTFTGPSTTECASSGTATFYIFGGTPPYTVKTNFPTAVTISGSPVLASGGGFSISPTGGCFTGLTFLITDAAGSTLLTPPTVDNVFGTIPTAPLVITPTSVSATGCTSSNFQFIVTGGTGSYSASISPGAKLSTNNPTKGVPFTATVTGGAGTYTLSVVSGDAATSATINCT
jgi:hypothetical protein